MEKISETIELKIKNVQVRNFDDHVLMVPIEYEIDSWRCDVCEKEFISIKLQNEVVFGKKEQRNYEGTFIIHCEKCGETIEKVLKLVRKLKES